MTQFELDQIIGYAAMQKQAAYTNMYKQARDDDDWEDYPDDVSNARRLRKADIGPGLAHSWFNATWPNWVGSAGGALLGGALGAGLGAGATTGIPTPEGGAIPVAAGGMAGAVLGASLGHTVGGWAGNIYGVHNATSQQTDAIAKAIARGDIKVDANGKILTRRRRRS